MRINYCHMSLSLWWQGGKRRLRTSRCPCRGRLGTLKTPSCPWLGCPAAGQNLETGHLSRHYIAKISLNMTLNHNQQQQQTPANTFAISKVKNSAVCKELPRVNRAQGASCKTIKVSFFVFQKFNLNFAVFLSEFIKRTFYWISFNVIKDFLGEIIRFYHYAQWKIEKFF